MIIKNAIYQTKHHNNSYNDAEIEKQIALRILADRRFMTNLNSQLKWQR